MKLSAIGRFVCAGSSRCICLAGLIVWLVLPGLAQADEYWSAIQQPFKKTLRIPLHGSQTVAVDLPQQLIDTRKDVCLTVDIESNFYFHIDGFTQKGFEGFTPKVSVNKALLFGNYEIGAKPLPARQTVDVHIKTKYFKAGRNTLTFALGVDPQLHYECQRGSKCIAYFIRGLQFADTTVHRLPSAAARTIACSFESPQLEADTWNLMLVRERWTGSGGFQNIRIDPNQGAGQSHACLAMTFKLGMTAAPGYSHRKVHAVILNRKARDLSGYSGIEFSVKATRKLTVKFGLVDSQPDRPQKERWSSHFSASTQWHIVRIAFGTLTPGRPAAYAPKTDGRLSLDQVETLFWVVHRQAETPASATTLYIDEIGFY
jgi:hypothetical protein